MEDSAGRPTELQFDVPRTSFSINLDDPLALPIYRRRTDKKIHCKI
jgi:hypothetical protein